MSPARRPRAPALACTLALAIASGAGRSARGQEAPAPDPSGEVDADNAGDGYTPAEGTASSSALLITGYVDLGFAKAQGDGTSFPPADTRLPADYGVDTFATAVNSRGDVASTDAGGRFVNGFLPRSAGIGGRASPLINTVDVDFRYNVPAAPLMFFSRLQLLPRFSAAGDDTRALLEQAFGRLVPVDSQELALSVGKFDSVVGIEYLDNQANIRVGVTPSLLARYTTGQSLGAKLFYRMQFPGLWSALSLNVAATTSGSFVESLQPPDVSRTGVPVGSGRLGYELNLPHFQMKVGGSALYGPRNDQRDRQIHQRILAGDLRLALFGIYLNAEYVRVDEDQSHDVKVTGLGAFPIASGFHERGFYAQLAYGLAIDAGPLHKITAYGRYDRRRARFEGFTPLLVDRVTVGLRVDLWEALIVKAEILINRELEGSPQVRNNVQTLSVVHSF
ncbi:MAG TPA: hypothetical protein VFH68_18630 [Polyangia bacterium]|jgi:hypothetical protein|nr:hypothetical protein [Polyangia bacterium]